MKHSIRIKEALSLALAVSIFGCATAVNGRTQPVSFSSDPPGAAVFVDGVKVGATPATLNLTRGDIHSVRIEKPSYVPYEMTTVAVENNWSLADAVVPELGLPELLGDHSLGGMYDIRPAEVSARLFLAPVNSMARTDVNQSPAAKDNSHAAPASKADP